MAVKRESGDTSHLYDGKTVRSSAPSRKALAGSAGIGTEIPKDAIPEIEVPKFIEKSTWWSDHSKDEVSKA